MRSIKRTIPAAELVLPVVCDEGFTLFKRTPESVALLDNGETQKAVLTLGWLWQQGSPYYRGPVLPPTRKTKRSAKQAAKDHRHWRTRVRLLFHIYDTGGDVPFGPILDMYQP